LRRYLSECVIFDKDLLWGRPASEHFTNNWLRIAYSIAQGDRHTIICGTIMPWDIDACEDRGLVGAVHFLNLHCNDDVRERRLRERPEWRASSSDAFIAEHKTFAHWLVANAATAYNPSMPIVDTSHASVSDVALTVAQWIRAVLDGQMAPKPAAPLSRARERGRG